MIDKIAGEYVAVRLRMLDRVITNIYDKALRPLDVKVSQMNILVATDRDRFMDRPVRELTRLP